METNDYEEGSVPSDQRRSWLPIALIWVAIGSDISGAFLGIELASGMSFEQAIAATLVGSLILGLLAMVFAYVGAATGLTTAMISRAVFGRVGGTILALALTVSMLGWFAVQIGFFGVNAQSAFTEVTGVNIPVFVFTIVGGAVMVLTAVWGYRAIARVTTVTVPLLLLLLTLGVIVAVSTRGFTDAAATSETVFTFGGAISLVMGIYMLGIVTAPDMARWAKSPGKAMAAGFVGFFFGNSIIVVVAIVLSEIMSDTDLVGMFFTLGLGGAAVIILLLAPWVVNTTNIYSTSLDFAAVTRRFSRRTYTLVGGLVGILIGTAGFYEAFVPFISAMGIVISPFGGVYLAAFIHDRQRLEAAADPTRSNTNMNAIIAWTFGIVIGALTTHPEAGLGFGSFDLTTIPSLDAMTVAFGVYLILTRTLPHTRPATSRQSSSGLDSAGQTPTRQNSTGAECHSSNKSDNKLSEEGKA